MAGRCPLGPFATAIRSPRQRGRAASAARRAPVPRRTIAPFAFITTACTVYPPLTALLGNFPQCLTERPCTSTASTSFPIARSRACPHGSNGLRTPDILKGTDQTPQPLLHAPAPPPSPRPPARPPPRARTACGFSDGLHRSAALRPRRHRRDVGRANPRRARDRQHRARRRRRQGDGNRAGEDYRGGTAGARGGHGGAIMIVGKYAFVFCGANDVGTGWFAVGQDGSVIGADIGNVTYNGTAREGDDGWITLDLELTIPAGTTLVQGTAAQDVPHNRNLHAYLPPLFGDGHPQQIPAGPGVATIMVRRVSDDATLQPVSVRLWKAAP